MKPLLPLLLVLALAGCEQAYDRELTTKDSEFVVQGHHLALPCRLGERTLYPDGSIWITEGCGRGLQQKQIGLPTHKWGTHEQGYITH